MSTIPDRLRKSAQYTGLDYCLRELLIEAAEALERAERKPLTVEQIAEAIGSEGFGVSELIDYRAIGRVHVVKE